jgi:hypothetical protein
LSLPGYTYGLPGRPVFSHTFSTGNKALDVEVLHACGIAFGAVFALLSVLAVTMWFITLIFRERKEEQSGDAALIAAVTATVASVYPGARVTRIEEEK